MKSAPSQTLLFFLRPTTQLIQDTCDWNVGFLPLFAGNNQPWEFAFFENYSHSPRHTHSSIYTGLYVIAGLTDSFTQLCPVSLLVPARLSRLKVWGWFSNVKSAFGNSSEVRGRKPEHMIKAFLTDVSFQQLKVLSSSPLIQRCPA